MKVGTRVRKGQRSRDPGLKIILKGVGNVFPVAQNVSLPILHPAITTCPRRGSVLPRDRRGGPFLSPVFLPPAKAEKIQNSLEISQAGPWIPLASVSPWAREEGALQHLQVPTLLGRRPSSRCAATAAPTWGGAPKAGAEGGGGESGAGREPAPPHASWAFKEMPMKGGVGPAVCARRSTWPAVSKAGVPRCGAAQSLVVLPGSHRDLTTWPRLCPRLGSSLRPQGRGMSTPCQSAPFQR